LPRMIDQFIGTEAMPWEDTLSETIEILKAYDIAWWLAGSGACAARGIDMAPHDIDIMTYLEEVPKIQKAFEAYTVEPFHFVSDWITKGFGVVFLGGRVDVAFEPADDADQYGKLDYGVYASEHLEEIAWHDHRIQVPPVELHLPGNESRNRHDRIKLINDYIAAL